MWYRFNWEGRKKEKGRKEECSIRSNGWELPKINDSHQTTDSGISENPKQDKYRKVQAKLQKITEKEKILKEAKFGGNEGISLVLHQTSLQNIPNEKRVKWNILNAGGEGVE